MDKNPSNTRSFKKHNSLLIQINQETHQNQFYTTWLFLNKGWIAGKYILTAFPCNLKDDMHVNSAINFSCYFQKSE